MPSRAQRYDVPALANPDGRYGRWNMTGITVYFVGILVQMPFIRPRSIRGRSSPRSVARISPGSWGSSCRVLFYYQLGRTSRRDIPARLILPRGDFGRVRGQGADVDPLWAGSLTQVARQFSGRASAAARITRNDPMKFMFIVKSAHPVGPTPALLEAMHKLTDREIKAGRLLDTGGLMPMAEGAQVRIVDGHLSVLDGPFVEAKEVIGGYAVFELHSKEEAVASAVEFMELHKRFLPGWEGTCELRAFAVGGP